MWVAIDIPVIIPHEPPVSWVVLYPCFLIEGNALFEFKYWRLFRVRTIIQRGDYGFIILPGVIMNLLRYKRSNNSLTAYTILSDSMTERLKSCLWAGFFPESRGL